jgi:hypothetical protein
LMNLVGQKKKKIEWFLICLPRYIGYFTHLFFSS